MRIEARYRPHAPSPPPARPDRAVLPAGLGPDAPLAPGSAQAPTDRPPDAAERAVGPGGVTVLAHGFTGSCDRPAMLRVAELFAQHTAVITFSFRGHGRSGGRSTVGDLEVFDLAAAVRWARSLGHQHVNTVGFSMGGSVVVRHAALYRGTRRTAWHQAEQLARAERVKAPPDGDVRGVTARAHPSAAGPSGATLPTVPTGPRAAGTPAGPQPFDGAGPDSLDGAGSDSSEAHTDAAVAVSAPARWYYRGTAPMRRVHLAVQNPLGRLVARYALGTRIHRSGWDPEPLSPVIAAPDVAPTPLLIVHGDRDPYFPLDHPRSLADAADAASTALWIVPGFGHAENAAKPALLHRIAAWNATASPPPAGGGHHGTRGRTG